MWRRLGIALAIPVMLAGLIAAPHQHLHDAELMHAHLTSQAGDHHHDDGPPPGDDADSITAVDMFVFPPAAAPRDPSPVTLIAMVVEPAVQHRWLSVHTARPRAHDPPSLRSTSLRAPPQSRRS